VYFEDSLIGGNGNGKVESIDINLDIRHKEEDNPKEETNSKEDPKTKSGFDFMSLLRENGNNKQEDTEEEIQQSRVRTRRSKRNQIMKNQIIEQISDDETDIVPDPNSPEKNESDMNHALLKSNDKKSEIDEKAHEEYINENIEFRNEKDFIEYVFQEMKRVFSIQKEEIGKNSQNESMISQVKEEGLEKDNMITEISKIIQENNREDKKNQNEEESTIDEGVSSTRSKTLKVESQLMETTKTKQSWASLKSLLTSHNDTFKDSVLKYMILNSESKIKDLRNKDSVVKDIVQYDQYLMNDNMEFLSVILTILYSEKDSIALQDPLIQQILKLLIKRLLNTTDNYIQCEKSFSMILTKFTKNVRERFNDLKSYLLNQKLKNMADLKIKTNTLVKKMNMTLDSVGGKNTQVASAVSKRHDQIEGFVGNYVERDEYTQLNLNKIMNGAESIDIPQLKGKWYFISNKRHGTQEETIPQYPIWVLLHILFNSQRHPESVLTPIFHQFTGQKEL
jgi:hypothetical protein